MKNIYLSSRIAGLVIFLTICSNGAHAQWVKTNSPLATSVYCFAAIGTNLFAGISDTGGGGVLISTDIGTTWVASGVGLPNSNVFSLLVNGTNLFAGTFYGVFLSSDSGKSWGRAGSNLSEFLIQGLGISNDTHLFAAGITTTTIGFDSIFVSVDNGTNWTGVLSTNARCFGVIDTNIFAGIDASGGGSSSIFLSTNNGTTWIERGLPNIAVEAFAMNGMNIFAGTTKGVFLSTNNGISWILRNAGLTHTIVLSLAITGTKIFAGTYGGGIFLSTNNGATWANVSEGLTDSNIQVLSVNDSNLFSGMYDGGGICKRPLSEMHSTNFASQESISSFIIEQNTPNPFSTSTNIHYRIPDHEHVRITLFNMLGEKVRTLLDEDTDEGEHDLIINAEDLSSGVFVVTMSAGGLNKSEKICVLK